MEFINPLLTPKTFTDLVVIIVCVCLFLWGGTNKFGRKDEFNDNYASLDAMKSLRGLAAIGVMIHHVSQEGAYQQNNILALFTNAGVYFVAIFFFCSGYGLIKSLDTKKDYLKGFIRKRIVKAIVVPFYINVLLVGAFTALVKIPLAKERWVCNFLGLTMMNTYAWFPIVLALLYLVFFLCFRFIKNRPVCFAIIFVFIIALGIGFCFNGHYGLWYGDYGDNWWNEETAMEHFEWWQGVDSCLWFSGEWWVNAAPSFLTGLIFANYEKKIVTFFKKHYARNFAILLAVTAGLIVLSKYGQAFIGYWTEFNGNGLGIPEKIKTLFCQMPSLAIFGVTVTVFMMKYHVNNPVTRFFGEYSLHTYLMNIIPITVFRFMTFEEIEELADAPTHVGRFYLLIYLVCVLVFSTLLGVGEQKITTFIQNLLFAPRKKAVAAESARSLFSDATDSPEYQAWERRSNTMKNLSVSQSGTLSCYSNSASASGNTKKAEPAKKAPVARTDIGSKKTNTNKSNTNKKSKSSSKSKKSSRK